MKPTHSSIISLILIISLLLTAVGHPVFAQRSRPIVITFGQPNIWSLEQAHYLLARMHRQNLDLQTAPLGTLDPNATNASRIDILKTLLQAGVSFDQAVGLNNQLLRQDKTFNADRRRQLLNNRTSLQSESTQLARDIAALKSDKANAGTEKEQAQIQDLIDAKTEQKAAVDNELTQTNDEVKGLTSASGDFQSATVPTDTFTPITGDLDTLISKVQLINPSIAAILRLDNHIQMQYEIISKQLTLLRDEVGPGERVVFLELPQSINATQDRAENKMAQTWWRIAGYTKVDPDMVFRYELKKLSDAIENIQTKFQADEPLIKRNSDHREELQKNLDQVCGDEEKVKKKIEDLTDEINRIDDQRHQLQEAVETAEKSVKTADDELAEAIKSGNARRIYQAQEELKKTKRNRQRAQAKVDAFELQQKLLCQELSEKLKALNASLEPLDSTITEKRRAIQRIDEQAIKLDEEHAKLLRAYTSLVTKYERLKMDRVRKDIRAKQDQADRLLQGGGANTYEVVQEVLDLLPGQAGRVKRVDYGVKALESSSQRKCEEYAATDREKAVTANCEPRTFINLEEPDKTNIELDYKTKLPAEIRSRIVRTIDVIPRQNAINVQDTKQRVARTGIFAAFSFLFGFAGKFTYERQREQAEQFLNQELFTSGFGKGEKDFGWSFYPFAGTKQLSSGVRTTYAVAIIPKNAETLVLKARGCYFPRKNDQPLNYDVAGTQLWIDDHNSDNARCTPDEQVFVVPVPGGSGDGADYYVTDIRYSAFRDPGNRIVVSIGGQNLPSQVGILVNGVPLREAVGLGQLNIESILGDDKTKDNCVGQTCGRFERIDANQIILSFQTPGDFKGTPRIAIIGPGKEIEINKLLLTINGVEDAQLEDAPAMFGEEPDPPGSTLRRIADFKVAPTGGGSTTMTGVLTGSRFKSTDNIFVNGLPATKTASCRKDLCIVTFAAQETDFLTVTMSPASDDEKVVSKTVINPSTLSIISASVVSFEPQQGPRDAVLTVKLDGSGFKQDLVVNVIRSEGPPVEPRIIVASAGQMFLKITQPEAVVRISVRDPANNRVVSAVVVRPDPPPEKKQWLIPY